MGDVGAGDAAPVHHTAHVRGRIRRDREDRSRSVGARQGSAPGAEHVQPAASNPAVQGPARCPQKNTQAGRRLEGPVPRQRRQCTALGPGSRLQVRGPRPVQDHVRACRRQPAGPGGEAGSRGSDGCPQDAAVLPPGPGAGAHHRRHLPGGCGVRPPARVPLRALMSVKDLAAGGAARAVQRAHAVHAGHRSLHVAVLYHV